MMKIINLGGRVGIRILFGRRILGLDAFEISLFPPLNKGLKWYHLFGWPYKIEEEIGGDE